MPDGVPGKPNVGVIPQSLPPKPAIFSVANVSWLLDTRKDTIEKKVSVYFPECKGLSIDDVGEGVVVEGHTPYCRRYDRESAGFETGDFTKRIVGGGATVGRLIAGITSL